MNETLKQRQETTNLLISHLETLCKVAVGLTKNKTEAEYLVRKTAVRVFQNPDLVDVPYPKVALLTLLRDVFVQASLETPAFVKKAVRSSIQEESSTRIHRNRRELQETVHVC
jgi:hypothetical protein